MTTAFDDFLAANERFAAANSAERLPVAPARRVAVLACMDARIDLYRVLGLSTGDAHIIRNAGGRASDDAIRSLVISSALLGTREVVVIHHTDCGMQTFTNEELRSRLAAETGVNASAVDFLPFDDLEQSVRDDVRLIARSVLLDDGIVVTGCIYEVETGRLRAVGGAVCGRDEVAGASEVP